MDHLKSAIYRMKYGLVSENPLLEQMRMEYTEVYMAVVTAIEDLECMENIFFDSNEIGYICLHIFRENTLEHLALNNYDLILNTLSHRLEGRYVVKIRINFTQKDLGRIRHFLMQQYPFA